MLIQATHSLNQQGQLKNTLFNEYTDGMTALDVHIWFECEKVKSNCYRCGLIATREDFAIRHSKCADYSGEPWKDMVDRRDWIEQRSQELGIGEYFVCKANRPLVRHKNTCPPFYASNKLFCNCCNDTFFAKVIKSEPTVYFRCSSDDSDSLPCQCNYDICSKCLGCPNGHILKRWRDKKDVLNGWV